MSLDTTVSIIGACLGLGLLCVSARITCLEKQINALFNLIDRLRSEHEL